jgi:hypothetical protein
MELDSDVVLEVIRAGPDPAQTICICLLAHQFLNEKLLPVLQKFEAEAIQYCISRNADNEILNSARICIQLQLEKLFGNFIEIGIYLMSSFGANMHLHNSSDIDFGVLVKNLTKEKVQLYGQLLERAGFKFGCEINNYFVYQKKIFGTDIEVKLRDYDQTIKTLELHRCLDQLPYQTQRLLTYAKALTFFDPILYTKLKKIIYSAYYTQINM